MFIRKSINKISTSFLYLTAAIVIAFSTNASSAEEKAIGRSNSPISISPIIKEINSAVNKASEATLPSVVYIEVEVESNNRNNIDPEFLEFFKYFGMPQTPNEQRRSTGAGSGVIISSNGYIVTNEHVVGAAIDGGIIVKTSDKKEYKAKLIGKDPLTDIALIKIDATNLQPVHFGDMDKIKTGEFVLAVGNPLGLNSTVTYGIISAINRGHLGMSNSSFGIENYIQTDAAINPGNSGGGLFNLEGSLIGINTLIASQTGSFIGYGFAIPVDLVKAVVKDLIDDGKIDRGFIGIQMKNVDENFAKKFGLNEVRGVLIENIIKDSPAEKAQLKTTDIILKAAGKEVNSPGELQRIIAQYQSGNKIDLLVWRDEKEIQIEVILGSRDDVAEDGSVITDKTPVKFERLGFSAAPITDSDKEKYEVSDGAIITEVERYGIAEKRGVSLRGIITKIDKEQVKSPKELKNIIDLKKPGDIIILEIKYETRNQIIAIEIPE